ncbi:alpha-2-glucosyltransferase Alg10 [Hyaloraphidium curvatum]|nr:alpha-2-glucosyltransferase Alg10 [Hyaloraphidium curvatum]
MSGVGVQAAYALILAMTFAAVNRNVPLPYMDEPFHVPQAQRYCRGDFMTWDPKLTTPPGLYVFPAALLYGIRVVSDVLPMLRGLSDPAVLCSVAGLRTWNILFALGTLKVLRLILLRLRSRPAGQSDPGSESDASMEATVISLFPLSFFFHFLYYTDTGSAFFVLLGYLWMLEGRYMPSAGAAFVSLWFRQTNSVWTLFIAALAVTRELSACAGYERLRSSAASDGDKSNHVAGLHVPQVLYFSAFAAFYMLPLLPLERLPGSILGMTWGRARSLIFAMVAQLQAVRRFTLEHPFLLADNRHYTFYIWKNIFRRHPLAKYLVIPGYTASFCLLWWLISPAVTTVWLLGYLAATAITLVPSPLLEFRYFIIPYILLRLHVPRPSRQRLVIEGAVYAIVNALTLWIFLTRTFTWPSDPGEAQRFMW